MRDRPHSWASWLYLVEFCFNTSYHSSTKMSPFEALYGFSPPKVLDYVPSLARVAVVDTVLHDRFVLLDLLKQNLVAAQAQMKAQVDLHWSARFFQVGD